MRLSLTWLEILVFELLSLSSPPTATIYGNQEASESKMMRGRGERFDSIIDYDVGTIPVSESIQLGGREWGIQ